MKAWKRVLIYSVPTTLILGAAPAALVSKGDPVVIAGGLAVCFVFASIIGFAFIGAEAAIDRYAPEWLKRVLYKKVMPGEPVIGPTAEGAPPRSSRG